MFGNSEVLASYKQIDVKEKTALYKLDLMQEVLEVGDNEITYHWKDSDGVRNCFYSATKNSLSPTLRKNHFLLAKYSLLL